MSSVGDATSTLLPMSSPVSRTSTNTVNPAYADEVHTLPPSRSSVGGPRKMDTANGTHNNAMASRRAGEHGDLAFHNGMYLFADQFPRPGQAPALRSHSTKQLIHRFESMTDTAEMIQVRRYPGSTRISPESDLRGVHHNSLTIAPHKSKRRSLSNSLRNFMSVFKKKKDKESDDDDYVPPNHIPEQHIPMLREPPSLLRPQIVSRPSEKGASSSSPLLSGSLLYFSHPPSHPPVWISCTVALYGSRLLITRYTMHDAPSTHMIQLNGFMDVHSLNERVSRLDAEGDMKAFELSFEGRPRETFAATSTQDRARWIGAIWDTVLSSQHKSELMHPQEREVLTIRTDIEPEPRMVERNLQPSSSPEEARSEYTSSSAPKTSSIQQTPPPTPVAKSPQHLSPLSISPPRPPSRFSNPYSRFKSPSITNLGTLSVVTQRLAQIERSEASSPVSASTQSSVGTALRRAQTARSSHHGHPFSEIERLRVGDVAGEGEETPSTDASIVIPLPNPPTPFSETSSVRSAFKRDRTAWASPAPTPPSAPAETPVAALRAELSEPAIRKHIENPPTTLHAVGVERQLAPLAELIKDVAAKHYDQTAGLGEQIISLQRDIHVLPGEMQVLLGRAVATAIKRSSKSVDGACLQQVAAGLEELRKQILANSEHPQLDSLFKMFEDLRSQLVSLAPVLMEKLVSIEHGQAQLQLAREAEQPPVPSSDISSKLDELASLFKSNTAAVSAESAAHDITPDAGAEKLQVILDHLRLDEEQRKLQVDQQADSVRYLNELNSWLDTFVNGGTAHIQSVAANVEQLCSYLGVTSEGDTGGEPSGRGMLGEIRHLISSVETKASSEGQLQVSVGELMDAVREQMNNGTEQRTALVTDSVLEIINRQRHEQEQMLRALSTELTNEIRGERLRFVEAMKEATAINVQAHVEHFKAELGREVAVMTQDVGRLHQEKQAIEQQIADLFSFYSKQKQEAENNPRRNPPPRSAGFNNLQNLPASTQKRPRRPLPHPVFQKKD